MVSAEAGRFGTELGEEMRKRIIAGNWKMHKTADETRAFMKELSASLGEQEPSCEMVVAPPFTAIPAAVTAAEGTAIKVGGQNLHWEDAGAYTGEISGGMLKEIGCSHVIIGHSERREYFGETDESVNRKIAAALRHKLIPIFCVGERLEEREAGRTFDVVRIQVRSGLVKIRLPEPNGFVVAYEPVWAIGTGKTATPEQGQEVHAFIRAELSALVSREFADGVRVLYGGSVKPENTAGLMACNDIDGALVGGASLNSGDFMGIIHAAG